MKHYYKIQFKSRLDPYDDWEDLNGDLFNSLGEAQVDIEAQEIEDEEMNWDFKYRVVEV